MPRRYHPALVTLHWILAFMLIGALAAGTLVLEPTPNSDPGKLLSFRLHMGLGVAILALMLIRVVVRLRTAAPAPVTTQPVALSVVARLTHAGLYGLAIAMAGSGIALSITSGLPDAVFGAGTLPPDFSAYPARAAHGLIGTALLALIVLHVAAAIWHHAVLRDGLLSRMWFGPR